MAQKMSPIENLKFNCGVDAAVDLARALESAAKDFRDGYNEEFFDDGESLTINVARWIYEKEEGMLFSEWSVSIGYADDDMTWMEQDCFAEKALTLIESGRADDVAESHVGIFNTEIAWATMSADAKRILSGCYDVHS